MGFDTVKESSTGVQQCHVRPVDASCKSLYKCRLARHVRYSNISSVPTSHQSSMHTLNSVKRTQRLTLQHAPSSSVRSITLLF